MQIKKAIIHSIYKIENYNVTYKCPECNSHHLYKALFREGNISLKCKTCEKRINLIWKYG